MRFYIIDCNGCVFGNPKGYATMRGAKRVTTMRARELWDLFECSPQRDNTVYEIKGA